MAAVDEPMVSAEEAGARLLFHRDRISQAAAWDRTRRVRRRILTVQLQRLAHRASAPDAVGRDAAARALRLASRLELEDMRW
jgi:hypothetical protein